MLPSLLPTRRRAPDDKNSFCFRKMKWRSRFSLCPKHIKATAPWVTPSKAMKKRCEVWLSLYDDFRIILRRRRRRRRRVSGEAKAILALQESRYKSPLLCWPRLICIQTRPVRYLAAKTIASSGYSIELEWFFPELSSQRDVLWSSGIEFLSSGFWYVKFIYSEKATKFCEISTLLLTVCTVVKSKVEISQNFVAFSEYMNFTMNNVKNSNSNWLKHILKRVIY